MDGDSMPSIEFDVGMDSAEEFSAAAHRLIAGSWPVDQHDCNGTTLLYLAAFRPDADAVEALLALGADPNGDPSPLGAACWGSSDSTNHTSRVISLLVKAGADVHARDAAGWSVIHGAAMPYSHGAGFASSDGANTTAIKALAHHGADLDTPGPDGTTALTLAARSGNDEAVEFILTHGAIGPS